MKKLLLSTAAVALMSTAAVAADLPIYEAAPMVAPVPQASDWTGAYIGVHGGYGFGNVDGRRLMISISTATTISWRSELEGGVVAARSATTFIQSVCDRYRRRRSYSFIDNDEDSFDDDDDGDVNGMESESIICTIRGAGFAH
jgi:opacity protein-like surface antigen